MPSKLHLSKDAADYGPGHKNAHCGICVHFQAPNACEIVDGKISRSAWCNQFKLKNEEE